MNALRTAIALGLVLTLTAGCQYLYPSDDDMPPEQKKSDKPLFDAEFYSRNAKEYFDAGRYALARDQWNLQLKLEPSNWLARLGVASCDYFLGAEAADRGDLRQGRELLASAETRIRELWDGTIEEDTLTAFRGGTRQWQAALFLARSQRGLATVDRVAALRIAQREQAAQPADKAALAKERAALETQSRENARAALDLFARLAAMSNASEDAVVNHAEMLGDLGRANEAEAEFGRYLEIAERTRMERLELRKQLEASTEGHPEDRKLSIQLLEESVGRNARIQAQVHDRLGALRYDRAQEALLVARDANRPAVTRKAARAEAEVHLQVALRNLARARELAPDRHDLLVKSAQCEGDLGQYRQAIDLLSSYIEACSRRDVGYNADLNRAYRLRSEYEEQLKKAMAGS